MENRYLRFFESVKQLLLQTEVCSQEDFLGVGNHVIEQLEKKYGLTLPLSLKAFLLLFGKKINIPFTDGFLEYTVSKIEKATQMAENENIVALLKRTEGVRDWINLEEKMIQLYSSINIDNILFLHEREMGGEFVFIDCLEENPSVHFLKKEYVEKVDDPDYYEFAYGKQEVCLINYFRIRLFLCMELRFVFPQHYEHRILENSIPIPNEEVTLIKAENIDWIVCHAIHRTKYPAYQDGYSYYSERDKFYKRIEDKEKQGGEIMTINEFEWAFIEHLRGLGMDI
jgi:hypothetical protein